MEEEHKRRKYSKRVKKVEAVVEIPEIEKEEVEVFSNPKEKFIGDVDIEKAKPTFATVEVKERRIVRMRYFIIYTGRATHLSLSGVGRITIGKRYEVRKEVADFLDDDRMYKVIREPVFEE